MPPGPDSGPAGEGRSARALIQPLIRQAIDLHRAGRLDEAEALYERVLAEHGPVADALHLLGLAALSRGQADRAIGLIERAVAADPAPAAYHHSLGEACRKAGRPAEASAHYRAALERDPSLVDARIGLGDLARAAGDHAGTIAHCQAALDARPGDPRLHLRLAEAQMALGRCEPAAEHYRQAIALGLDRAGVHNNRGLALAGAGRTQEAVTAFHQAARLDPDDPMPLVNLGDALLVLGDLDGAERALDAALHLDPALAAAHLNRGNLERRRNRLAEAVQSYRRASVLAPGNSRAQGNLGLALAEAGRIGEAIPALRLAVELAPDDPVAASNLCYGLCYDAAVAPPDVLAAHRRWNERFGRARAELPRARPRGAERRLRIGYVSPDFCRHPVGAFVAGPIHHHDRDAVEVFCYAAVARPDAVTARIRAAADRWRETARLDDFALAQAIRADGIDILVDLSGHMAGSRLSAFAHRPAPVQVAWAGYPFSTGVDAIDWALVDNAVAPPGAEALFTERLHRLPLVWTCYTPPGRLPEIPARPPHEGIVFGSFNNPQKIDDATVALWSRLLASLPAARLVLKAPAFEDAPVRDDFARRFARHGAPRGAIAYAGASGWDAHLAAIGAVDIALDPLPYTGATTTIETLLMGVPVVTQAGATYFRRHAVGMLSDAGLGDLVAGDAESYLAIALGLAGDGTRRQRLRCELRAAMLAAPVCDAPGFTRALEDAYRAIWRDACGSASLPGA
ncbi:MAG: tetratricopeptide repeat protein [Alphaproteobacteria bacterium]|nr:tetratricopeptide repeat protein [Alphaproteobacteria bacterium]